MSELDRMRAQLDDARRFYRAERQRLERLVADAERDAKIDALLIAHTPWRMRAWLGVMPNDLTKGSQ